MALACTAAAAIALFIWACQGYIGLWLFATALSLAGAAVVLLPVSTWLFRDTSVLSTLTDWFAGLCAGTPLLAAVLAIIGQFNCASGALFVSGLFGALLAVLVLSRRLVFRSR
jgi:hypothetical protein